MAPNNTPRGREYHKKKKYKNNKKIIGIIIIKI